MSYHHPCLNPACPNPALTTTNNLQQHGLCRECLNTWARRNLPVGGYMSTTDCAAIGEQLLETMDPQWLSQRDALRILRGPRYYNEDHWSERPLFSLHRLMNRSRSSLRQPHILVGRKTPPTIRNLMASWVHFHLAKGVMGAGRKYCYYLAGATFFGTRGLYRPLGQFNTVYDPRLGESRRVRSTYHLTHNDFTGLGLLVLKSAKRLTQRDPEDPEVHAKILKFYFEGLAAGTYHDRVIVHPGSKWTIAAGDHVLCHYTPRDTWWSPEYADKVRRPGGTIAKEWPEGLDLDVHDKQALRKQAQLSKGTLKFVPEESLETDPDWIFNT